MNKKRKRVEVDARGGGEAASQAAAAASTPARPGCYNPLMRSGLRLSTPGSQATVSRRRLLQAVAATAVIPVLPARAAVPTVALAAPQPMAQLHAGADLLAVSVGGALWRRAGAHWERLGEGLDPATPIAQGHGRIVGRGRSGGLWVYAGGRFQETAALRLAPHAGFAILAFGVIAVAQIDETKGALVRLEEGASGWTETARCAEPVLPDARPLQVDLGGVPAQAGNGHIVVLAGPDGHRYAHGVLGDAIEATRVLYLERHDLSVLRALTIASPHVLEDIAPRPVAWNGGTGLLTMRAGPQGAQLVVVAADLSRRDALRIAAAGEPIGTRHRWMAASTDGRRIVAVHTPHIGGVLHAYRRDGATLRAERVSEGVATHALGSRELDLAVWAGGRLMLPGQDRRTMRQLDIASGWRESGAVGLPAPVVAARAWAVDGVPGAALLLADGSVHWTAAT
jgi:hypothetical protein